MTLIEQRYSGSVFVQIQLDADGTHYLCAITDGQDHCKVILDIETRGDVPHEIKMSPDTCDRVAELAIITALDSRPTSFKGLTRTPSGQIHFGRTKKSAYLS